jgi:hypothetical protein
VSEKIDRPPPERKPDDATRLATLVREFQGRRTELRIERAEFDGRRFTKLQVWEPAPDGTLRFTRKTVTVRDRELPAVLAALQESRRLAALEDVAAQPTDERPPWMKRAHDALDRRGG